MATVSVLNTTAQLTSATLVTRQGDWTITGTWTFDNDPSAPFVVTSGSAVVSNLDADLLDGEEGSHYLTLGLSDPGADRLVFWDDSEGNMAFLTVGSGLKVTTTTINPAGLDVNTTQAAVSSGAEETLWSFTIPANTFAADGDFIEVFLCGTQAGVTASKTNRLYFDGTGGTVIAISNYGNTNATEWFIQATIVRDGASSQKAFGTAVQRGGGGGNTSNRTNSDYTDLTGDETGTIDLVMRTDAVNANDVVFEFGTVKLFKAP